MKSTFTLLFALLVCYNFNAQELPNGSMEEWMDFVPGVVEFPVGYFTSQVRTVQGAPFSATKSEDAAEGDFAIKLETQNGEFSAWAAIGELDLLNPPASPQGTDFSDRPTKLTGYLKGSIEGDDVSRVLVLLLANDELDTIGLAAHTFSGVEDDYISFETDFTYNSDEMPDEIQVNISTDYLTPPASLEPGLTNPGNFLFIDGLALELVDGIRVPLMPEHKFDIYPNPARDFITLEIPESLKGEKVEFSLFNSMGQQLNSQWIDTDTQRVDLGGFSGSVLFYQVKSLEGTLLDGGKISIQK